MDNEINKIIKILAKEFNFSEENALEFIKKKNIDEKEKSEDLKKKDINPCVEYKKCTAEIINYPHCIPYCGIIYDNLCKGIVYNHGLYTQCKKHVSGEFCNGCQKLKYGRIEDRKCFELGKFITNAGKKEINYEDYVKKANLPIDDIKIFMSNNNLLYPFKTVYKNEEKKQKRGRPVKDTKKEVSTKIDKADDMISKINENTEQKSEQKSEENSQKNPGVDKSVEESEPELEEELEAINIDGKILYKTTSVDKEGFGYDNEGNEILFNKELEVIGIIVDNNIKYI